MSRSDELYEEASSAYGPAIHRLVRAYEADPDKRRDLLQDIHLALWRSFDQFEGRCSLRTWTYRVAHNTATSHVIRQRRSRPQVLLTLEEIETAPAPTRQSLDDRIAIDRLYQLIHTLKPLDRELMLLYLEDLDATSIGEITGLSAVHVRTQIHRIKRILAERFHRGISVSAPEKRGI